MVTIGVDAHKATHTLVATDDAGRKLEQRTVAATSDGHLEAIAWAAKWPDRRFALEDCRHSPVASKVTCSELARRSFGSRPA